MPWVAPAAVQVFLMDQEQSYFRLWMIRDGQMVQYAPDPPPEDGRQPALGLLRDHVPERASGERLAGKSSFP